MTAPRPTRKPIGHQTGAVAALIRECDGSRESAVASLEFFAPLSPQLRTPEALAELLAEFGDELPDWSWLKEEIAALKSRE